MEYDGAMFYWQLVLIAFMDDMSQSEREQEMLTFLTFCELMEDD